MLLGLLHLQECCEARFIAGMGIGGEYAAINSAIDEMIPARCRGRIDIAVNGTYWAGAIIGTLGALLFLHVAAPSLGWRLGFLIGPALAVVILYVRRNLPESPRWLLMHGSAAEADRTMAAIEDQARSSGYPLPSVDERMTVEIRPARPTGYRTLVRLIFTSYRRRAVLGATLMITQSFLYSSLWATSSAPAS